MVTFIRSDLEFILNQILIAESGGVDGSNLVNVLPNVQVPWGLRTVDGSYNNLVFIDNSTVSIDQTQFGAADTVFPRLLTPVFRPADLGTSYAQTSGTVVDAQPRIISNLIVDQTANNPAAVAAAAGNDGAATIFSPGLDGVFGTADDSPVFYIPNVKPDFGLTVPFNAWFTFFGQFFDHGLDLVTKGGQDIVFVPLQPDDPLFEPGCRPISWSRRARPTLPFIQDLMASWAPPTTSTTTRTPPRRSSTRTKRIHLTPRIRCSCAPTSSCRSIPTGSRATATNSCVRSRPAS